MADKLANLIINLHAPTAQRWSGSFPVEVRDARRLVLAARGVSGQAIQVPAGEYFVTAVLPDGQQAAIESNVKVDPGETRTLEVSGMDIAFPPPLASTSTFGDSFGDFVRPLTQFFSNSRCSIIRDNWLLPLIEGPEKTPTLRREPTSKTRSQLQFNMQGTWLEHAGPQGVSFYAVPIDPGRSTYAQWHTGNSDNLLLKFDFNDGSLNSLFDFVETDLASEARSISRSTCTQLESYMFDKSQSPLRAILSAYVLMRANELENMDMWTQNLLALHPVLPDALVLRMEYLARNNAHQSAARLLLRLPQVGMPCFRSGIGYTEKLAKLYANVANQRASDLNFDPTELIRVQLIARYFAIFTGLIDMSRSATVLHHMQLVGAGR